MSWTDGASGGKVLEFTVGVGTGATGLQAMLPMTSSAGSLKTISRGGSPVTFTQQRIDGIDYAFFNAAAATYQASYTQTTIRS